MGAEAAPSARGGRGDSLLSWFSLVAPHFPPPSAYQKGAGRRQLRGRPGVLCGIETGVFTPWQRAPPPSSTLPQHYKGLWWELFSELEKWASGIWMWFSFWENGSSWRSFSLFWGCVCYRMHVPLCLVPSAGGLCNWRDGFKG